MKKEDQRIKVTKILIKDSLSKLLKEKDIDKISIKELCDKAGINRGTFYTHYKDLDDLQNKIYEEFYTDFQKTFIPTVKEAANSSNLTSEDMILNIINFLFKNKETCLIMLNGSKRQEFVKEMTKIGQDIVLAVYPKVIPDVNQDDLYAYYNFVSGGSIQLLVQWLEDDCKIPNDELSKNLNKLIASSIFFFTK